AAATPLVKVPRDGRLGLSFGQQRLWFLDELGEGSAYHVPRAYRLVGEGDGGALEGAVQEVGRRPESLRARVVTVAGRGEQRSGEEAELRLKRVDLRGTAGAEEEAKRLVGEEVSRPFDLGSAPLLRASLIRVGDEEWVFVVVMHHIVSDGWSMG